MLCQSLRCVWNIDMAFLIYSRIKNHFIVMLLLTVILEFYTPPSKTNTVSRPQNSGFDTARSLSEGKKVIWVMSHIGFLVGVTKSHNSDFQYNSWGYSEWVFPCPDHPTSTVRLSSVHMRYLKSLLVTPRHRIGRLCHGSLDTQFSRWVSVERNLTL